LTGKLEEILKSCDSRMFRYMARVRRQDRISSEEVAERCGLKMIPVKLRQKRLQWFGHVRRETENGGRSVENSGRNESIGEEESRKSTENLKDIVKRDLKLIGVDECVALDRGRWRTIIASPTPT